MLREQGVGGSNPLAPTNFPKIPILQICCHPWWHFHISAYFRTAPVLPRQMRCPLLPPISLVWPKAGPRQFTDGTPNDRRYHHDQSPHLGEQLRPDPCDDRCRK